MKSLNRTLSLVLVLAMCLGMMGIASAATFTDAATTQYTEAVEVMTGIGAINGYADGTFKPTGTITREEAAKMVTYAVLSPAVASKLSVAATGFKDVDSARWSAPYIAFCVGKGIINGMGDGTFAPTANVTGYQLAKMMLSAIGYGAKGEFTGSSWELNVAVLGNKCKIFSGSKAVDYSKTATREEAALYVFNAITNPGQVSYSKLTESYSAIEDTTKTDLKDKAVYTIAEQSYSNLETKKITADGVVGYRWMYKGQYISSFVGDATLLKSSMDGTSFADLTTPSKSTYINYDADNAVTYYYNGIAFKAIVAAPTSNAPVDLAKGEYILVGTLTSGTLYSVNSAVTAGTAIASTTTGIAVAVDSKRGVVVSFFDTNSNSKYDVVNFTQDVVKQISGDVKAVVSGAVTLVTVPGITGLSSIESSYVNGYEGLKKDDYVMWHKVGDYYFLSKCASFTGTLNAYNTGAEIALIDGKQYKVTGLTGDVSAIGDIANYAGVAGTTYFTDKGGNIVKASGTEASVNLSNVVYVLDTSKNGFVYQALVLRADGKTEIISVAKTAAYNSTLTTVGTDNDYSSANGNLGAGVFYTAAKNTDGSYYLTATNNQVSINNYAGTTVEAITHAQPLFLKNAAGAPQGVVATNGTVFVYYDATNGAKVFTGIANAPTFTETATAEVAYITDKNGLATLVVATSGTYSTAAVASASYAFAYAPASTVYVDATTTYSSYKSVVNGDLLKADGTAMTMDMKAGVALTPGVLTAITSLDNGKGAVTNTTASQSLISDALAGYAVIDDFVVAGTSLICKNDGAPLGAFVLNANAKIYKYNGMGATKPIEEISASDLGDLAANGTNAYTLQAVETSSTDTSLKTLFVTPLAPVADDTALLTTATLASLKVNTVSATLYTTAAAAAAGTKMTIAKDTAITVAPVTTSTGATVTYSYMSTYTTTFTGAAFVNSTTKTTAAGSVTDMVKITVTSIDGAHTQDYFIAIDVGA